MGAPSVRRRSQPSPKFPDCWQPPDGAARWRNPFVASATRDCPGSWWALPEGQVGELARHLGDGGAEGGGVEGGRNGAAVAGGADTSLMHGLTPVRYRDSPPAG